MHSIRAKITAVAIAAILTSMLVLGVIGVVTIGNESDRASIEKMGLISENMQRLLDAYLDSIEQSVGMGVQMAGVSLKELDISLFGSVKTPEQQEELDRFLTAHCAEIERALSSIASKTSGTITYYYCINSDLGSNEHGFSRPGVPCGSAHTRRIFSGSCRRSPTSPRSTGAAF